VLVPIAGDEILYAEDPDVPVPFVGNGKLFVGDETVDMEDLVVLVVFPLLAVMEETELILVVKEYFIH
jgi:hypothetical protein